MHITIVFPRLKTFSGAEHFVLEIARHAVSWNHSVTIVTRGFNEACRSRLAPGVELRCPRFGSRLTGVHLVDSFLDVALSPFLLRRIPSESDILLFVSDPVLPALWYYKKILRGRTPVVYYCLQPPRFVYDLMSETVEAHKPLSLLIPALSGPYRWLDKVMARSCDAMLAISRDYSRWCKDLYGVSPIHLVHPGVDIEIKEEADADIVRSRHGVGLDERIVLTVNKLIARKNIDVLLYAMKLVKEHVPKACAIVVGDGPVKPALLALRQELDLVETVIFTGFLQEFSDVADYYAASDLYVFLEKNVPFGLTVLEASVFGKPVLAVRGGGTNETVIDGESGILVEAPPSAVEVADKICWFLENDEKRIAMGQRAELHAQSFRWESRVRELIEVLEKIVAGNTGD